MNIQGDDREHALPKRERHTRTSLGHWPGKGMARKGAKECVEECAALASGGGRRVTRLESVALVWKRPLQNHHPAKKCMSGKRKAYACPPKPGVVDELMQPICSPPLVQGPGCGQTKRLPDCSVHKKKWGALNKTKREFSTTTTTRRQLVYSRRGARSPPTPQGSVVSSHIPRG